jgi:hypothetical protein
MEGVHRRYETFHVVLFAEKTDMLTYAKFPGEALRRSAVRSIAGHDEFGIDLAADLGERVDAIEHALNGTEI